MSLCDRGNEHWFPDVLSQWLGAGAASGQAQWWIQMVVSYAPMARDPNDVILCEATSLAEHST